MPQSKKNRKSSGIMCPNGDDNNAIGNGVDGVGEEIAGGGGKQKQKNGETELILVMEPQNTSPTKYFDQNGIALKEAFRDALPECGSPPRPKIKTIRKRTNLDITCHRCLRLFDTKLEYEFHYRCSYNEEPTYVCPVCGKRISQYKAFRLHIYRHSNSANHRYACGICLKVFHQKSDLTRHETIHESESMQKGNQVAIDVVSNKFSCDRCDAVFGSQTEMRSHNKKVHPSPKQMTECPECGKVLSVGSLYSHRKIHSNGPKYTCEECNKTFVQKINYIHHRKKHLPNDERPFPCGECGKAFHEKSHLQRHLFFHSNERPFTCETCGKTYKTERCLKVHSAVHNAERPFVCTECNKGFLSSSKLRQHSNIHSGLRPHKCKYCTRDFTNFPNWLKHIRRRHKVDHRTGEKLVSVPKFMTKKKDKVAEKKADTSREQKGKEQKEILPLSIKEESLPFVEENSNIDLNLVSKEDLLQPLKMEYMEDIFSSLPESGLTVMNDENACDTEFKRENIGPISEEGSEPSLAEQELTEPPLGLAADDNELFQFGYVQPEFDCDYSIKQELLLHTEAARVIRESEAATSDDMNSPPEVKPPVSASGALVYDINAELPIFPTLVSICGNDQQYQLINPNFLHLPQARKSSADNGAGGSSAVTTLDAP
ncbi:zinc finger protein 260-like [Toxorhynchites rutilus septentrionalis]|uniref:zinc finger protein 260-like n=1 Tax=Toxorhynchites rutilus septentrionalis TaxID=329112 RepID=UPI00247955BC|nr:zinc finger protein 260-like [Toxorhynchites rutilus septentrionalis]